MEWHGSSVTDTMSNIAGIIPLPFAQAIMVPMPENQRMNEIMGIGLTGLSNSVIIRS